MYVRGRIDFLVDILSNFGLNMLWKGFYKYSWFKIYLFYMLIVNLEFMFFWLCVVFFMS